jgi:pilus assembly protein CpaE
MSTKNILNTPARGGFAPSEPLTLATISLDNDTLGLLKLFAQSAPLVRLRAPLGSYRTDDNDLISEWLGEPPPDVCLIDFDKDRRNAALTAESIRADAPGTSIFAVSSQSQAELIIQAMHSGCNEYLVKPINRDQLLNALARVGGRKKEKKDQFNAQILAFIGAKGGCGVTTLVTQMGALLAKTYSRKTLLVDLHPDFGDAALYLGLTKSRYHSFELLENTDRLDAELLQGFVSPHSSGLSLIPAPEGSEAARHVSPGAVAHTFDFLRLRSEFILVDLPPGLNDQNLELIQYCDHLYLVTVAEVSALRNVTRLVDYFTRKGMPQDKLRVVLNRHQKNSPISDAQIEKAIRQKIHWKVPNQYAHVVKTINEGDPLAHLSRSDVMRNLSEWAGTIGRKPGTEYKKEENHGFLGFLNR